MKKNNLINNTNIQGSIVALITPMFKNGSIDIFSYKNLINWHIKEKTDALVIVGTTGESSTVTLKEKIELIKIAVKQVNERIKIIAGVGSNSTIESIELSIKALKAGANAGLSVTPYYNKPNQKGIYFHFKEISENTKLPIILYDVPSRTSSKISIENIINLSELPNIIGIKDATGNIKDSLYLLNELSKKNVNFRLYSGDDSLSSVLMLMGAKGSISVTANIFPNTIKKLCDSAISGDLIKTKKIDNEIYKIYKILSLDTNPIPIKFCLNYLCKINYGFRLPLSDIDVNFKKKEIIKCLNHLAK